MAGPQDEDIEAWLRKLRSQAEGMRDGETQALRRVIEAHVLKQQDKGVASGDDAAWQQLRFLLRREGLVSAGRPAWRIWVPAAAVVTLVLAFGLPMLLVALGPDIVISYDAPPVLRGGPSAQEIAVDDPLKSARRAAAIVTKQQGRPAVWFYEGRALLDFEVEDAALAAQTQKELQRELPQASIQPGFNRLVFQRRP